MGGLSWSNACIVGSAFLLVLVTVLGPLYAFVIASCVSTRPCTMGSYLFNIGATCGEGSGERSESMLHGETCTIVCAGGLVPTTPQLTCVDGETVGLADLQCLPPVIFDDRPIAGGLVDGAITGGEAQVACQSAKDLKCDARAGGSAVLLMLPDLTEEQCRELFEECQSENPEFEFMQHTKGDGPMPAPGVKLGTCLMGCFQEILSEEMLSDIPWAARVEEDTGLFAGATAEAREEDYCEEGPMCVDVSGSCNDGDNGDYYRYPLCVSSFTQWAKADGSQRIRYDGNPANSQMGKWIIEMGADPALDAYGLTMARQQTYLFMPTFGTMQWRMRCRTQVTTETVQETFKYMDLTLGNCTCTDEQDCSGHGQAIGTKVNGPECSCICDTGRDGDHCEIPLCKVPTVLAAEYPPCAEGDWLDPGEICTPRCLPGYKPTYESFTCGLDGKWPADKVFQCIQAVTAGDDEAPEEESEVDSTTPAGPCSEADCSYRGEPTGIRFPNGTCQCVCYAEYTGMDCRGWVGNCKAPLSYSIENSYTQTCKEGMVVNDARCTAQCEEGYWPAPAILECRGEELVPPTFRCFGGTDIREVWCQWMQYTALGASGVATLSLLAMCFCFGRTPEREVQAFYATNQLVEVAEDEEGKYSVVRMDGKDIRSKLPRAVVSAIAPADAVTAVRPLALGDTASSPKALQGAGIVPISAAERAFDRKDLRSLAAAAAQVGAVAALEAGPLVLPEQLEPHDFRRAIGGGAVPARALQAPELLAVGNGGGHPAVSSSAPPPLADGSSAEQAPGLPGALEEGVSSDHNGALAVPTGREMTMMPFQGGTGALLPESEVPLPSDRFQPGQQVSLCGLIGHQALNGVQGQLVEFDYDTGLWVVELEGFENELKQVPERCMQELQLSVHDACKARTQWHFEMHRLQEKAEAARMEHDRKVKERQGAAAAAATAAQVASMEETTAERMAAEAGMRDAFSGGDVEALREAAVRAREVLAKIAHCSASDKAILVRLVQTAESRLEQHDEREAAREAKRKVEEKIRRGKAPDWKMTPKQFWKFVEEGNVEKVNGGIRAMQPLSTRSADDKRLAIMHVACQRICADAVAGGEAALNRVATIQALLKARANPNPLDLRDRTPLEFALEEGGAEAASEAVVAMLDRLRELGLSTATEAAASIRASEPSSPTSPGGRGFCSGPASPMGGGRGPGGLKP